ncbi:aldehyde dehydrogenase family protein, partial [bacterium]
MRPENSIEALALSAASAFETFSTTSPGIRAVLLERIAQGLEGLGDELLQTAHEETSLPLARLTGERGRTCAQLRMFGALLRDGSWIDARIERADPARSPLPKPDLRRMLVPLGPVAVFGASNFPFAFSVPGG